MTIGIVFMASDCEQLFGLNSPFSEKDLRKKYHELAKLHHPDYFHNSSDEQKNNAHEMMLKIGLCNDELKDSIGRKSSPGSKSAPGSTTQPGTKMSGKGWTIYEEHISNLKREPLIKVAWDKHLEGTPSTFQEPLNPIQEDLKKHIKHKLYTHQAEALDRYRKGENLVLVTPTASGKSLGYMLPFFEQALNNPDASAIFIFPMKALANDQYANFERLTNGKVSQEVFDGDTDKDKKAKIKKNPPNVLYTNPDELHHSILFTAPEWAGFFKNLKLIVLDEIHIYKGSFGSNVANIIERLLHIVKVSGGNPQIICTSATISNPLPFAEKLTKRKFHLIDKSGAGQAEKFLVMVQPQLDEDKVPLISPANIAVSEAINFAANDHQVIVFVNSRSEADILANHAKFLMGQDEAPQPSRATDSETHPSRILPDQIVSGYHAGYSKENRRKIESLIKSGHIKIVFSTNALELGVDIGTLDVCILFGVPPTNNEIWQRIGRAGRKSGRPAMVVMVHNMSAFDEYHFTNPQHFMSSRNNPDRPIIDPMNSEIRKLHLNCAYFEGMQSKDVADKANWRAINKSENKWWAYHRIQIRGGNPDPYALENETGKNIGEIDYDRAYRDLYPGALYELDGTSYKYKHRDFKKRVFTLQTLLGSDEFTTPLVEIDVRIDGQAAQESILKFASHSVVIGHGQMELDKLVQGYNLRHKLFPELKQFKQIKYPDKWPTEKVSGFWLSPLPGTDKDWEAIIADYPEVGPYSIFIILHTIEHLLIRSVREMGFCDWPDLAGASSAEQDSYTNAPATIIYETQQKGIGLTKAINDNIEHLLEASLKRLQNCPCIDGCPACILTPPFCLEKQGLLDKELTKLFLTALLKPTSTKSTFSRDSSDLDDALSVPRNTYVVGDQFQEGWNVFKVTDEGIIVHNKDGDMKVIPFEDIPL